MAFFNKLGESITVKSKIVAKKAKDFAEVANLNSQISTEEDIISKTYLEIGKVYFEQNKNNESDSFSANFHTIIDAQTQIEQLRLQIEKVKGIRICPSCGAEMQLNSAFCSSCGTRTDTGEVTELPAATASGEVTETPVATASGEVTETPVATASGEVTETPVATVSDEVTEAPVSTASDEVTQPQVVAPPATKVCANCGAELTENSTFCTGCGTKIEG